MVNGTLEMAPSRLRKYGPLRIAADPLTWRSAAYLLLHFPIGLGYFIGLVVMLSVSAGMLTVVVGVLGFALAMVLWRCAAVFQRKLAWAAFGVKVPSPYR